MSSMEADDATTTDESPKREEPEVYPTGIFSRTVVRFPCATMLCAFSFAFLLSFLAMSGGPPEPQGSWLDLTSPVTQSQYGLLYVQGQWQANLGGYSEDDDVNGTDSCNSTQQSTMFEGITLIFHSHSGKVLGDKALETIDWVHREIYKLDSFEDFCLFSPDTHKCMMPMSALGATQLATDYNVRVSSCSDIWSLYGFDVDSLWDDEDVVNVMGLPKWSCHDVPSAAERKPMLEHLCSNGSSPSPTTCESPFVAARDYLVGLEWNCHDTARASFARSFVPYGAPQAGYGCWNTEDWSDDESKTDEEQWDKFEGYAEAIAIPRLMALMDEIQAKDPDLEMVFFHDNLIWCVNSTPRVRWQRP